MAIIKKMICEFIGTAVLVICGCGTAVALSTITTNAGAPVPTAATVIGIALAFGLSIVAMAYSIGNVSGCHINPAVSTAMLINGKMTVKEFICYIIAQFAGATAGAGTLWIIFGSNSNLGADGYGPGISAVGLNGFQASIVEAGLTFIFVLAVMGATEKIKNSSVAGIVIGLSLTLVHLFGIPLTGTSVNPARSFGPAVLQGGIALRELYVFLIAPTIGAIVAALVYKFVIAPKTVDKKADLKQA